jgi:transcriptional regulator ATRX
VQCLSDVACAARAGLTGTPFQNNLLEYFAMLDFVRPGVLGQLSDFRRHYVTPIEAGQHSDSDPQQVRQTHRRELLRRVCTGGRSALLAIYDTRWQP